MTKYTCVQLLCFHAYNIQRFRLALSACSPSSRFFFFFFFSPFLLMSSTFVAHVGQTRSLTSVVVLSSLPPSR